MYQCCRCGTYFTFEKMFKHVPIKYRKSTNLPCKAKWQYLLTCKVSRYCISPLPNSIVDITALGIINRFSTGTV